MNAMKWGTAIALAVGCAMTASVALGGNEPVAEEVGNNLSYPAKFLGTEGAPALRLPCTGDPTVPSGPQCTDFAEYPGEFFWCQKTEATWQAACTAAPGITTVVNANWGANLVGDGRLMAGKPIRVEMNLAETGLSALPMPGYAVIKLTPDLEDRFATYGTRGDPLSVTYSVFDAGASLMIEACDDPACVDIAGTVLPRGPMSSEINATGNIVYGYNWGIKGGANAPEAGTYKLTFFANQALIASSNGQLCPLGENCTFVIVTLAPGAGGPAR